MSKLMSVNRLSRFDGKKAFQYLKTFAVDIGPRHGGSANEIKAARYIRDKFQSFGLKASLFPYRIHTFESATASLFFPGLGQVDCVAVPCCASTLTRGVTAKPVFIEEVHEVYLEPSMRGKIIITREGLWGKNYEALMRVKPAGIVQIARRMFVPPTRTKVNLEKKRKFGSVPMVNITYEDGLRILTQKPRQATLSVQTKGERLVQTYNPMGELKGREKPDEVIVIGGHFDSVWGSQGAQDNAAGAAVVMELARVFARQGSRRTLRFMGFSGEEPGLIGSHAYVKKLKAEDERLKKGKKFLRGEIATVASRPQGRGSPQAAPSAAGDLAMTDSRRGGKTESVNRLSRLDKIIFMVNIDMQGMRLGSNLFSGLGPSDIAASVRLLAAENGPPYEVDDNKVVSSDSTSFGLVGVPSASFGRTGASLTFGHTDRDVIDHCDAESLADSGRFIEKWLQRYITLPKIFPFKREIPSASQEQVKEYFRDRSLLE